MRDTVVVNRVVKGSLALLVLALASCGPSETNPPTGGTSLDQISGFSASRRDDIIARANAALTSCMADAGFTYAPVERDPALDGIPRGFLDAYTVDALIEYRRHVGYGGAQAISVVLNSLDANHLQFDQAAYVESLSADEQDTYLSMLDPANADGCSAAHSVADLLVSTPSGGDAGTALASEIDELRASAAFLEQEQVVAECLASKSELPAPFDELENYFLRRAVLAVGGKWDDSDPEAVNWEISTEEMAQQFTREDVEALAEDLRRDEIEISQDEADCWEDQYAAIAQLEYEATEEWRSEYFDELKPLITNLKGE